MIPGSKEQLHQESEYTLLKPDCHSWWISKMQSDILEERLGLSRRAPTSDWAPHLGRDPQSTSQWGFGRVPTP